MVLRSSGSSTRKTNSFYDFKLIPRAIRRSLARLLQGCFE